MPVLDYAKEIPLIQKPKPERKKNNTKALLFQTGDPVLNSAGEEAQEEEQYDLDAEHIEIKVPVLVTQENETQAHIYESTDPQVNNLFDQFNYNNQLKQCICIRKRVNPNMHYK